jgi:exonuclease SbcC
MSHGAQTMSVRFDFQARGQTYRVARSIGKSTAARLERQAADGTWDHIADRAKEVVAGVEHTLGLDYDTFTKTVLLPQGEFDTFLRGDPKVKHSILSDLLGLGLYERMRTAAYARAAAKRAAAAAQGQQADHLESATPEAIAALEAERTALEARVRTLAQQRAALADLVALEHAASERARTATNAAEQARTAAAALAQATTAAAAATAAQEEATQRLTDLTAERATLAYDAEAHAQLKQQAQTLQQRETARRDLLRAQQALATALQAAALAREQATQAARAAERQRLAAARAAAALATARAALVAAARPAQHLATALRAAADIAEQERIDAEALAVTHDQRVRALAALAQQLVALQTEQQHADGEATAAIAAAAQAEAARVASDAAETAAAAALTTATAQQVAAQRAHTAAGLRRGLQVGDPCPVCGEPITSLAALEDHAAGADLDAADAAVATAERTLADARAAHQRELPLAATAHARAETARTTLAALEAKFTALDAQCEAAATTRKGIAAASKRATADAAAERKRATTAAERATAVRESAHALDLLLATLPTGIETPATVEVMDAPAADAKATASLERTLRTTLDAHAGALTAARATEDAARSADEAARTAEVGSLHATEIEAQATTEATAAEQRLHALGADSTADAEALLAALTDAEQRAERAQTLDAAVARGDRDCASTIALAGARTVAAEAATAAATLATAACTEAEATAATAREAYAQHWRALPGVTAAPDARALSAMNAVLQKEDSDASGLIGAIGARIESARRDRAEAERLRSEAAINTHAADVAAALERELHRNNFVAFVEREAMQALATEAAARMEHLSRGRYRLRAEGDEFMVIDRQNGDEQRSVKTLSGGETFLASLALALALAERLPSLAGHGGALSLESLFLDEGFGSLDADALDVAIEALEMLAGGDRMIGVISHVPLIAERLPDHIEVTKSGGSSSVRGEHRAARGDADSMRGESSSNGGRGGVAPAQGGRVGETLSGTVAKPARA